MRLDIDTYREILDTITRNKSRSFLTGFGVFWGVFMLVALIGGGQGLQEKLQNNFAGFASNTALIWNGQTTKPYKGFNKGRAWSMTMKDVERIRRQVPELDVVTPLITCNNRKMVVHGDKSFRSSVEGVTPDYAQVMIPQMYYGRFINSVDVQQQRKVCVLGKRIYKNLFPKGGDPCGQTVRVDSTYYRVVGVDYRSGDAININGKRDETISLPQSVLQAVYNRGEEVDLIAVTAKPGVVMSSLTDHIRAVISHAHTIAPNDERAVTVFNTELTFAIVDNLFKGVNILIWMVGIGTLLAGAIGVSNIMMVTVKERTTEIGIRRAIGATPKAILSQIIAESIVLTLVAGMSGILCGVAILQMLELMNTEDGILTAHFQINFWTALLAAAMVCLLGGLAGMAPAWRAMSIKPVDAMRDE